MRKLLFFAISSFLSITHAANASEVSFVQGLYKDFEHTGGVRESVIAAGGRYSEQFHEKAFWFGEVGLSNKAYSGGSVYTPDDSLGFKFAGGARYYFDRYNDHVVPFAVGFSALLREEEVVTDSMSVQEVSETGLFYGGDIGVRLSLNTDFFIDLESSIFRSALYSNTKTKTHSKRPDGRYDVKNSSRKKRELFADTNKAFSNLVISLGMRL